jgi:hypothetical protein
LVHRVYHKGFEKEIVKFPEKIKAFVGGQKKAENVENVDKWIKM